MLDKLSLLSEATKETHTGRKHTADPGGYGRKYDTDEEGEEKGDNKKEPEAKRGRGRPKKGADDSGQVKKYDNAQSLQGALIGNKPKKSKELDKLPSKKHTLKDWFEKMNKKMLDEAAPGQQLTVKPLPGATQLQDPASGKVVATGPADKIKALQSSVAKGEVTMTGGKEEMAEEGDGKKWIKGAIKHPGAFTKKAKAHNMSTSAFAKKVLANKDDFPAKTEKQAQLAKTLGKMNEDDVEESGLQAYLGNKKYGKEGMDALRKAGREGASKEKMAQIRAKHDKMDEADIPSDQVDMGAGLGAGRSAKVIETKKDFAGTLQKNVDKSNKDKKETEQKVKAHQKDGENKTDKKKVNESMHKHTAARLLGKSHALAKEGYNCRYEDMEESRCYHEGFKEGLDECYGMMPVQGLVGETGVPGAPATPPATTGGMASQAAAQPAMAEGLSRYDFNDPDFLSKVRSAGREAIQKTGDQSIANLFIAVRSGLPSSKVTDKIISPRSLEALDKALADVGIDFEDLLSAMDQENSYWNRDMEEGNAFTAALAKTDKGDKFTVGGKTFTDRSDYSSKIDEFAFESLDKQLSSLLTEGEQVDEGMSVSISKGQQGMPDTVSVSAQDGEAEQLLGFIKQAGLGLFGDSGPSSNYGAPEGDSSVDHGGIKVVGDHDGMMGLMKKIAGIEQGSEVQDYESEEDHDHDDTCEAYGQSDYECDESQEMVGEVETDDQRLEQVAETDLEDLQKLAGTVPKREVAETDMEELQKLAGTVPKREVAEANPPDSGAAETTADENAEAEEDKALAMKSMNEGSENLTEWANDAGQTLEEFREETFEADIDFMMNVISSGLNKKKSTGQQTVPVLAGDEERTNIKEGADPLDEWKALSGIK